MTDALQRGSVVLRRGHYGIVWQVDGAELVVHPVTEPSGPSEAGDIALSFAELICAGIELPSGHVRCGRPLRVSAEGQEQVGMLAGTICCSLSLAIARAYAAAETEVRWSAERRHRHEATSIRPVRMG